MRRFDESVLSFKCESCGVYVYNATHEEKVCSVCGNKMIKVDGIIKKGVNHES